MITLTFAQAGVVVRELERLGALDKGMMSFNQAIVDDITKQIHAQFENKTEKEAVRVETARMVRLAHELGDTGE